MTIKILADSASDLTVEDCQKYNIEFLPLTVQLDGEEYEDGVTISPKEVYEKHLKQHKLVHNSLKIVLRNTCKKVILSFI